MSLLVTDYDVAVAFYCETTKLFRVYANADFGAFRNTILVYRGCPFSLNVERTDPATLAEIQRLQRDHSHLRSIFSLPVEDCAAEYERLSAAGVEFLDEMYDLPWSRQAPFLDPFGNCINLIQSYLNDSEDDDG